MTEDTHRPGNPGEAFALLGHEIRLDITLALLDRWRAAHTTPQRYSELMRAVGMADSGKFNYHLDRLRDVYLRKTDDGYVPTASATALYRAVLANRPTETVDRTELDPDVSCPTCGAALVATYDTGFISLRCPSCAKRIAEFTYPFPQNGFEDRTDTDVLRAVFERARSQIGLARRGQCPECAGRTTVSIDRDALDRTDERAVEISCDTCTWVVEVGVLLPLLSDARVGRALVDLDCPVETAYHWELPEPTPRVTATDPLEVELEITAKGRPATIVVSSKLDVRSVSVEDESERDSGAQ